MIGLAIQIVAFAFAFALFLSVPTATLGAIAFVSISNRLERRHNRNSGLSRPTPPS